MFGFNQARYCRFHRHFRNNDVLAFNTQVFRRFHDTAIEFTGWENRFSDKNV